MGCLLLVFFGLLYSGELCTSSTSGIDMAVMLSLQDISVDNLHNPQSLKYVSRPRKQFLAVKVLDVYMARTKDNSVNSISLAESQRHLPNPFISFSSQGHHFHISPWLRISRVHLW